MSKHALGLLLALTAALPLGAQYSYPASASTRIGFAQLADGGPLVDRWSTTINLLNLSATHSNGVLVSFFRDNGQPLALDFGSGPSATLNLTLPPGGVRSVTSTGTSPTLVMGWALAESVGEPVRPIMGVATYRSSNNGVTGGDVAAIGTGPTFFYSSYATDRLGVAVVNPDGTSTIHLRINAVDKDGADKGSYNTSLVPRGHEAFVLADKIPALASGFTGSITIEPTDTPPTPFGAWTLASRNDFLSTLPPGEMTSPGPRGRLNNRRPLDIAVMVQDAGKTVLQAEPSLLGSNPTVVSGILGGMNFIVDTDPSINATCRMGELMPYSARVHITTGLIEALGASDAALAFIITHKSMHAIYDVLATTRSGPCVAAPAGPYASDPEGLADAAAEATLLQAGFDPSGAAEFYSRLLYAHMQGLNVDPALLAEFGILPYDVPARLTKLWSFIGLGCSSGGLNQICAKARKYWHPSNPVGIP
jgi:hypothetical protein